MNTDDNDQPSRPLTPEEQAAQDAEWAALGAFLVQLIKWCLIIASPVVGFYVIKAVLESIVRAGEERERYEKENTFTLVQVEIALFSTIPDLQKQVIDIQTQADTVKYASMATATSETALLLLRNDQYWSHTYFNCDQSLTLDNAEAAFAFSETTIRSRSSIETLSNREGVIVRRKGVDDENAPEPGHVYVVSILAAYKDKFEVVHPKQALEMIVNKSKLLEAGSINLHPSEGAALSESDFTELYPNMIKL